MQIDWLTVGAQIVNFLVLVWLLKRFLYGPIIRAMDRREERISNRLQEADQREQEAEAQSKQYLDKREQLEQREQELLVQARQKADKEQEQRLEAARSEVDKQRARWRQQIESEKNDFLNNLRRHLSDGVQTVSRKALTDMADAELEAQVARTFIRRMEAMAEEERKKVANSEEPILVLSAFELDSTIRGKITRALHKLLSTEAEVKYDRSPDLLCGIELVAGERRIGWSIDGYLDDLSRRIESGLESRVQPARQEE